MPLTPVVSACPADDCSKVVWLDETIYGSCDGPETMRQYVQCRTLDIVDACTDTLLSTGAQTKQYCVSMVDGTIPELGQTFFVTINNICVASYAVAASDIVLTDEVKACAEWAITGGTAGNTFDFTAFGLIINPINLPTGVVIGATDNITAINVANALNTAFLADGDSTNVTAQTNGNKVIICVSPAWFTLNSPPFGGSINSFINTITLSAPVLVNPTFTSPTFGQLQGGIAQTNDPTQEIINNVAAGLVEALNAMDPAAGCFGVFEVSDPICDGDCMFTVTSQLPGIDFTLAVSQTPITSGTSGVLTFTTLMQNTCNMISATSIDPTRDQIVVENPAEDTILFYRFVVAINPDVAGGGTFETSGYLPMMCRIACTYTNELIAKAKGQCCTPGQKNCPDLVDQLKVILDAVPIMLCQGDIEGACEQLRLGNALRKTSKCYGC